ncbi:MAG: tetratricopeptide repeat protein [Cyanomargarita calcarea GSE-NOS-MK-12-04C]|uniref:Tetratricopeptide repeat protein n=1 Tax=Cyanomargarita calcarea GSE-NOS-MK-12-04C TaxID=2839659 RepID=A0A951QKW2_9CYAN|nr:tetratricopeptide repeat protein [Cyanomargarita calcarea GSE-NOS-MK-12-04C]
MSNIIEKLNQLNSRVVKLVEEGDFESALLVTQQAVKLGEESRSEHPAIADSLNNLAELYRMQGRYLLAKPLYLKAFNMRKSLLGESHPDIAQSLNNLAAFLVTQGHYQEAEEKLFAALDIWKQHLGEEHTEIATNLNNIAEVYREQGRYRDAEQMHLKALSMRKHLLGNEDIEIAQSLGNLAALYETQAQYSKAEELHLEALAITKKVLGDDHWYIAVSFNNLAALYDSQGRFSQAEENYYKALNICQQSFGAEHSYIAITLNNIASNYKEQGRYQDAEKKHLEALAMRKNIFGDEHPEVAMSLSHLAEIYQEQGSYQKAEKTCLEAYQMRKRLLSAEHPDIAVSLQNLAVLYSYQGRYPEAEAKYLAALSLLENLFGKEHPDVAQNFNNLAGLYQEQGRFSQAEQKYLESLEIRKKLLGQEHPDIADSLGRIAELYRQQGRYNQAEEIHLEVYRMRKRLLGEMHPDVAASLNNLAVLYDAKSQYSQAELSASEALLITKNLFGNNHPQVASNMNNLAAIYGSQGRYLEAEEIHLEALKIRKSLLGETHPDISNTLNNLANIYFALGRYPEAEQKYREALSLRQNLLGESHPDVVLSLNNLATVLTATNRPAEALSCRIQASNINDKIISNIFSFSSENDRLAFVEKIRNNFDLFLSLVCNHLPSSQDAKQAALDFVLKRKAVTASALTAQNQALANGRYPHLTEKFRQLNNLSNQIIHLTFAIPQTDNSAPYQENLKQLRSQYNSLQKQLAAQVPEIQLSQQTCDSYTVASALPNNSVLIEFVRFDTFDFQAIQANSEPQWLPARYVAFILPANQPDAVQMVDLGEASTIDELILQFCTIASDNTKNTLGWGKKAKIQSHNPATGIQLYKTLWQPIQKIVQNYQHIIIAPDSNLNLLPFQTLPCNDAGTRLLIDECTISYLSVGRDILRSHCSTSGIEKRAASPALILADPDFDLSDVTKNTRRPNPPTPLPCEGRGKSKSLSNNQLDEFVLSLDETSLSRAPGTKLLGESIAKKLPGARLYTDIQALETRLTANDCPIVMLIATHGLFIPDSQHQPPDKTRFAKATNPMLRSGLALAGANIWLSGGTLPKQAGKGFILAQDIAGLDLWANELTVLSACDTARGDIKIGEGVFGLRRAFAIAGSKRLVMSLWKVPDKATALLMEPFFDYLHDGMGCAEALRKAQNYIRKITVKQLRQSTLGLEVLKERLRLNELSQQSKIDCHEEDEPLEHPFYWGAWICQGGDTHR